MYISVQRWTVLRTVAWHTVAIQHILVKMKNSSITTFFAYLLICFAYS